MSADNPIAEFRCCECRRLIVRLGVTAPPDPRLCAECLFIPGWFNDPVLRRRLDPDYRAEP